MEKTKLKLSLTLPALERLIGGDSEIEVELRHQVIKEFLKAHINDSTKDIFATVTKNALDGAMVQYTGSRSAKAWEKELFEAALVVVDKVKKDAMAELGESMANKIRDKVFDGSLAEAAIDVVLARVKGRIESLTEKTLEDTVGHWAQTWLRSSMAWDAWDKLTNERRVARERADDDTFALMKIAKLEKTIQSLRDQLDEMRGEITAVKGGYER